MHRHPRLPVQAFVKPRQQRTAPDDHTAEMIFFLKCRKPEVYGERLKAEQIQEIKASARREVIAEMQRELADLTPSGAEDPDASDPGGMSAKGENA